MSYFPAQHNVSVYRGDTVTFTVEYKEGTSGAEVGKSLTGATTRCNIRTTAAAASATTNFTVTPDADQVANPGLMTLTLSDTNSALLTGTSYVYDLEISWADGSVQTLIYGTISVTADVSRAS